jgi:hypothetical protein
MPVLIVEWSLFDWPLVMKHTSTVRNKARKHFPGCEGLVFMAFIFFTVIVYYFKSKLRVNGFLTKRIFALEECFFAFSAFAPLILVQELKPVANFTSGVPDLLRCANN